MVLRIEEPRRTTPKESAARGIAQSSGQIPLINTRWDKSKTPERPLCNVGEIRTETLWEHGSTVISKAVLPRAPVSWVQPVERVQATVVP